MYQLLIRNGTVIDPANGLCKKIDVAVEDGKIAAVGSFGSAGATIDVNAGGCVVTPGLIDHHAHLWPMAQIGIPADAACFAAGVTSVVDAGSTGCANLERAKPLRACSRLGIWAYLNVSSTGLDRESGGEEDVDPAHYDRGAIREAFQEYGGFLLGLKLRTSRDIVGALGYEPLRQSVRLADALGVPLKVHCTNPPGSMAELLSCLRPGDIMTHMYMGQGDTILNERGEVSEAARAARRRGVLFEAADARAHFSFAVGEAAVAQDFLPDIIATDLTRLSMHSRPTVFNMANQLGKYESIGMSARQVLRCCTVNPARHTDRALGTLSVGARADIAVFRRVEGAFEYGDRPYSSPEQVLRTGKVRWEPLMTVKDGETVYRRADF